MASKKTVADMLMERLIDWGVDTIFGYPGDGVNGLFEGLRTHQERMKFIQVRRSIAATSRGSRSLCRRRPACKKRRRSSMPDRRSPFSWGRGRLERERKSSNWPTKPVRRLSKPCWARA
jgi:hypothetical protein